MHTLVVAALLPACLSTGCTPPEDTGDRLSVSGRLSGDTTGYARVTTPRALRFPDDHGPHDAYKHEWWYVTGRLRTEEGRRFGFQFTLFREAVSPRRVESPSHWATRQVYLAHAAVTDVAGERYFSDERFARGALGLAGAHAEPFRVWLEDWKLSGQAGADGELSAMLAVRGERFGFDLELRSTQPPVSHGQRGMSVKGAAGNASYYYSYTRLDAGGLVRADDRTFQTAGEAWLDHEWSSSALKPDQAGWDWFSLQLSDGAELMVFRLRNRNDPQRDFYSGTFVSPAGDTVRLRDGSIRIRSLGHWTSERTRTRYPVRWRLAVPGLALTLTTSPWLDEQEFAQSFRYWEGAVEVDGERNGMPVSGGGYVELAGYGPGNSR